MESLRSRRLACLFPSEKWHPPYTRQLLCFGHGMAIYDASQLNLNVIVYSQTSGSSWRMFHLAVFFEDLAKWKGHRIFNILSYLAEEGSASSFLSLDPWSLILNLWWSATPSWSVKFSFREITSISIFCANFLVRKKRLCYFLRFLHVWLQIPSMAPFHYTYKLCIRGRKSRKIFPFDFVDRLFTEIHFLNERIKCFPLSKHHNALQISE